MVGKILCSKCGRELIPPYDKIITKGGKPYCEDCGTASSKKTVGKIKEDQAKKQSLFQAIKNTYKISEVNNLILSQIENYIKEGKTYEGIDYCVNWYVPYVIGLDGFAIETYGIKLPMNYYDEAKLYYIKESEREEKNSHFDFNKEITRIVEVDPPKTQKWKAKTRIEDL